VQVEDDVNAIGLVDRADQDPLNASGFKGGTVESWFRS